MAAAGDGTGGAAEARQPARAGAPDDLALVAAMRRGDQSAYADFYLRFEPMLLALARRLAPGDGAAAFLVVDVLTDVAHRLTQGEPRVPANLAGYLAATLARRVAGDARRERRHERLEAAASEVVGESGERAVRGLTSDYALQASRGPDPDAGRAELSPTLARLAHAMEATFTADERRLAALVTDGTPQKAIAEALGVSYGAVRVRILRFRRRVWAAAAGHAADLPQAERAEVRRFLQRANAGDPSLLAALAAARPTPADDGPPPGPPGREP